VRRAPGCGSICTIAHVPPGAVTALAEAAARGDQRAWDQLVDQFGGLVWSVARSFRLGDAEAEDVFQVTWLRLVEHLDSIRNLEGLGGWLATTARHESLRTIRRAGRQVPVEDAGAALPDSGPPVSGDLLTSERDRALWDAFGQISERCQRLLRLLMADPPPAYDAVSAVLEMPIGSIGPTRARCLARLRAFAESAGITIDSGDSSP
jgi:RNA polymerase sigma factor (sigma-70 family)